ncbi:hypothetical protein ACJX0J_020532 [Zea mays]
MSFVLAPSLFHSSDELMKTKIVDTRGIEVFMFIFLKHIISLSETIIFSPNVLGENIPYLMIIIKKPLLVPSAIHIEGGVEDNFLAHSVQHLLHLHGLVIVQDEDHHLHAHAQDILLNLAEKEPILKKNIREIYRMTTVTLKVFRIYYQYRDHKL